MIALFIGIFAGLFSFLLIDKTVFLVKNAIVASNFSTGLRAASGSVIVQFLWVTLLAVWLGLVDHYLKSGHHINSIRGYDNAFVMLSALILGFAAYRLLRKSSIYAYKKHYEEMVTPGKEFAGLFYASLAEPGRILIYLGFCGLFGIHRVTASFTTLFFLALGAIFGVFIGWSLFCSYVAKHKIQSTTEHLLKYSRMAAGFILILVVLRLVQILI